MMALGLLVSCFGCDNGKPDASEQETSKEPVLLYDFEEWRPNFHAIRPSNFGSITRSSDYAKSGKYSAKLIPGGNTRQDSPYFTLPLASTVYDFAHNVLNYRSIGISFYNPMEKNVEVTVQISTIGKTFSLNPGWNNIEYIIEHNFLNVFIDYFEDITSLRIQFNNNPECARGDLTSSDVVYLDDIVLNPVLSPVTLVDIKTTRKYEIIDFEELYQEYVMEYYAWEPITAPTFKVLDYRKGELPEGIYPTHGNRLLQITLNPGDGIIDTFPRIIIPDYLVKNACALLTEEELENAYICYDILNINYSPHIDRYWGKVKENGPALPIGEWVTFKKKLADCINLESEKLSDGCGDVIISTREGTKQQVLLLDNVRFEIIK